MTCDILEVFFFLGEEIIYLKLIPSNIRTHNNYRTRLMYNT